jgi:uncharacterized protein YcnI
MIRKLLMTVPALALLTFPILASAHVIVTPDQTTVGSELTFIVSVPNERETPVTNLKLDIPAGVTEVIPTVKDAWTIQVVTDNAKDPEATAITWSDGTIPVGQREDFSFSAQVPANAGELDWKAYQTYGDGTVVHWDQKPAGSDDATGNAGPYSVTKIVNDLMASTPAKSSSSASTTLPVALSLVAILLSIGSLLFRKK